MALKFRELMGFQHNLGFGTVVDSEFRGIACLRLEADEPGWVATFKTDPNGQFTSFEVSLRVSESPDNAYVRISVGLQAVQGPWTSLDPVVVIPKSRMGGLFREQSPPGDRDQLGELHLVDFDEHGVPTATHTIWIVADGFFAQLRVWMRGQLGLLD